MNGPNPIDPYERIEEEMAASFKTKNDEIVVLRAEVERLRAFEEAARSWLIEMDCNLHPQMWFEADVALRLRDILTKKK